MVKNEATIGDIEYPIFDTIILELFITFLIE